MGSEICDFGQNWGVEISDRQNGAISRTWRIVSEICELCRLVILRQRTLATDTQRACPRPSQPCSDAAAWRVLEPLSLAPRCRGCHPVVESRSTAAGCHGHSSFESVGCKHWWVVRCAGRPRLRPSTTPPWSRAVCPLACCAWRSRDSSRCTGRGQRAACGQLGCILLCGTARAHPWHWCRSGAGRDSDPTFRSWCHCEPTPTAPTTLHTQKAFGRAEVRLWCVRVAGPGTRLRVGRSGARPALGSPVPRRPSPRT
jgi:hypothetical protein